MNTVYQYSDAHTLLFVCMYIHMYVIRLIYIYIWLCTYCTYLFVYIYTQLWFYTHVNSYEAPSSNILVQEDSGSMIPRTRLRSQRINRLANHFHGLLMNMILLWVCPVKIKPSTGEFTSRSDSRTGCWYAADMCSPCNHTSWRGAANCLLIASPENTEVKWRKKWKVSC